MGRYTLAVLLGLALWFELPVPLLGADPPPVVLEIPAPAFELQHRDYDPERPSRTHRQEYKGPIIDTLLHVFPPHEPDFNESMLEEIIKGIRQAGVELAIFSPTPNDGRLPENEYLGKLRNRLADLGGGTIRNYCGADYLSYWLHRAYRDGYSEAELQGILQRLARDLDSGLYIGVGELGLYHFDKTGRQYVIQFPPNFVPFIKIVDLITRQRAWLHLHAEPVHPAGRSYEKEVFGGLELLFSRNPDLKLILSHTGMTNPANVRKILKKYPTLMMNIKIVNEQQHWTHLEPINNGKRELYEDWAQLLEEMPERFIMGTDAKFFRRGSFTREYKKRVRRYRRILGSLNNKAARMIAVENARRLFGEGRQPATREQNR